MGIHDRLKNYFDRQIAFYKRMLDEQSVITKYLEDGDLDAAEAVSAGHARESAALESEFGILLREWHANTQNTTERDGIRILAKEAADLASKLEQVIEVVAGQTRERRQAVRREWEAIRRGQNVVDRYRTADESEPDRIDRRA